MDGTFLYMRFITFCLLFELLQSVHIERVCFCTHGFNPSTLLPIQHFLHQPHEIVMGNFLTIVCILEYLGSFGTNYMYFYGNCWIIFLHTLHTKQGKNKIKIKFFSIITNPCCSSLLILQVSNLLICVIEAKGDTSVEAQSLGHQQFEHKWEQADDAQRTCDNNWSV
jgi:hypothetical protein